MSINKAIGRLVKDIETRAGNAANLQLAWKISLKARTVNDIQDSRERILKEARLVLDSEYEHASDLMKLFRDKVLYDYPLKVIRKLLWGETVLSLKDLYDVLHCLHNCLFAGVEHRAIEIDKDHPSSEYRY